MQYKVIILFRSCIHNALLFLRENKICWVLRLKLRYDGVYFVELVAKCYDNRRMDLIVCFIVHIDICAEYSAVLNQSTYTSLLCPGVLLYYAYKLVQYW